METRADEFVTQAREHLAVLEQVYFRSKSLARPADNRERIDRCLRLAHSLKGDAGFLGYTAIRTLANAMETVLETMRNAEAPISAAAIERLSWHVTVSRLSWMTWRTATERTFAMFSRRTRALPDAELRSSACASQEPRPKTRCR